MIDIKQLQTQRSKLKQESQINAAEIARLNSVNKTIQEQIKSYQKTIDSQKELTISEHALLRYVERVCGWNLEDLKNIILSEHLKNLHSKLGDGEYPSQNGDYIVKIKGNNIITIVTPESLKKAV